MTIAAKHSTFDGSEILLRFLKYIVEGIVVALAAYAIPNNRLGIDEVMVIGLIAAGAFAVLDLVAPPACQKASHK